MTPDFTYNHETNDFNESIGIDEKFQEDTIDKINSLVNRLSKDNKLSQSMILEEMVAICSDEQIAFLALCFIKDQLTQQIKSKKS